MHKIDLSKQFKQYYTAKSKPELADIAAAQFLSITGKGDPAGEAFSTSIQALYTAAYGIKFFYKAQGKDFVVSKLEGLWQFDESKFSGIDMSEAPTKIPRSEWEYRLLLRMPEFVTETIITKMIPEIADKKNAPNIKQVQWLEMKEGKCVQMLHVGPFSTEPESLKQIMEFCKEHGLQRNGLHHEIYLSDFRKTSEDKLKTILREPVK